MINDRKIEMTCRDGCGACCIVPSISSPIPGMPEGKPAFVPCIHLTNNYRCAIFESPDRPKVCGSLRPDREMCGACRDDAISTLTELEHLTG